MKKSQAIGTCETKIGRAIGLPVVGEVRTEL